MNSRYKFRGIHNGGWKKGFLSYNFKTNQHEIVNSQGVWPVISESVSQYTGRQACTDELDTDGIHQQKQDLCGGDIIRHEITGVDFSNDCEPLFETHEVRYSDADAAWRCGPYSLQSVLSGPHRLIGNIHETPQLLEEGKQ